MTRIRSQISIVQQEVHPGHPLRNVSFPQRDTQRRGRAQALRFRL